jgi:DNA-binding transcriptional MerR regulator
MRIGELALELGVGADTLRVYERSGVLPSPPRSENGYRDYGASELERVRMMLDFRRLGVPLDEAARLAAGASQVRCPRNVRRGGQMSEATVRPPRAGMAGCRSTRCGPILHRDGVDHEDPPPASIVTSRNERGGASNLVVRALPGRVGVPDERCEANVGAEHPNVEVLDPAVKSLGAGELLEVALDESTAAADPGSGALVQLLDRRIDHRRDDLRRPVSISA